MDRVNPGNGPVDVPTDEDRGIAPWMEGRAEKVSAFLKAMSHEGRLTILCHLAGGEKSVTELEGLLGQRQAAVSQQLARLRLEGLVRTRRDGKTIFYALLDTRVMGLLRLLPVLFGVPDAS
ncbi:MAG: transcriptional regulator [Acetobacteraceae bacterium]|nr:MAG: transcriptional regulator [Acetobacteraceae bacterium]